MESKGRGRWLAVGFVLMVSLAAVAPVAAAPQSDRREEQTAGKQKPKEPKKRSSGSSSEVSEAPSGTSSGGGKEAGPASIPRPSRGAAASTDRSSSSGQDPKGAAAQRSRTQGAGGNNRGTVKIDGIPFAAWPPSNEPHVPCVFRIEFWGFEAGKTASWSLTLHAPTAGGELAAGSVTFTEDARGSEMNTSVVVDLTGALAGSGVDAHAQQGYHVRLEVTTPDGPKHKMFWVRCVSDIEGEDDDDEGEVLGRVTIVKDTATAGTRTFSFDGSLGSFTLGSGQSATFRRLEPGTFTVAEVGLPAGWFLEDLDCDDADSTVDLEALTATIRVAAGEHVVCTFTNGVVLGEVIERGGNDGDLVLGEVVERSGVGDEGGERGALAFTGANLLLLLGIALLLGVAGLALRWFARHRTV